MNEEQKEHIEKNLGKEGLEQVENLVDSLGVNKDIIKTKYFKAQTKLIEETLKKSNRDFWRNLLLVIIGAVLGYFPTFYQASKNEDKTIEVVKLLNKQLLEKNERYNNLQTDVQQMRLELISIKKEMELKELEKKK